MNISAELSKYWQDRYIVLILDNEVTVGHFVGNPGLPWIRMVYSDGAYRVAHGYPHVLDGHEASREMKNWDQVNLEEIRRILEQPGSGVDCFVIGNNAGQGLPLAAALDEMCRASQTIVIFGTSLPEKDHYETLGYRAFCARADVLPSLLERARQDGRSLSLAFINTIQHDESNYHDP